MHLLRDVLKDVELNIQPGLMRIKWSSLGITEFAENCSIMVVNLKTLFRQIEHIENDLQKRVRLLSSSNLFDFVTVEEEPTRLTCKDFFSAMYDNRTEKTSKAMKIYESFGPILIKLEAMILNTNTGRSPAMANYYSYWEAELFKALVSMTLRNIETFTTKIGAKDLLFEVDAVVITPEILLRPTATEIYNIFVRNSKDFLERLKMFPRWMDGSCIPCKPIKLPDNEDFLHSFFDDIIRVQDVSEAMAKLVEQANKVIIIVNRQLQKWKRYRNLWSHDKVSTCEKFIQKNTSLSVYDEKFMFYNEIMENICVYNPLITVGSVQLNLRPLLDTIVNHCVEWKNTLGQLIDENTKVKMDEMQQRIEELRVAVRQNIKGLNRFKAVMQAIAAIQRGNISAELDYLNYQETYRVLRQHSIMFPPENEAQAHRLEKEWKELLLSGLYREQTLESTKERFAGLTLKEITDFCSVLAEFLEKYEKEGPGAVGDDLDHGMKLMEDYRTQFEELEARRIELVNAEMLFDIPLADYSDYLKAKGDFDSMEILYKLYKSLKNAREVWGKTLWANLNPSALVDGIDGFLKNFRKLPKETRSIAVGVTLDMQMKQFRNAVPLMVALKNEALRERHWKQLMAKTGIEFDMSPDRFTLDNMFAMELHRFQDIAEEIINNAIKELSIEKGVKEIAETWGTISFTIHKHLKGTEDRGYLIGATEDIVQSKWMETKVSPGAPVERIQQERGGEIAKKSTTKI